MTDSFIGIDEPTTIDKKADTEQLVVGANTVERERIQVSGAAAAAIASVVNSAPSTEYGLVTRNIPSGTQGTNPTGETAGVGVGAIADVEATGNGSVIAILKRLRTLLSGGLPAALVGGRLDVNVGNSPTLGAGTNNIGDVDVLTAPGQAAEAAALPAVLNVIAGDDGVDTHPLQLSATGDLKVTLDSEPLPAGTNNIGDVDIASALPAGSNNIGAMNARVRNAADSAYIEPSTLGEQQTQTTALQLIDDSVHARNGAFSKSIAIGGELDDTTPVAATEGNVSPARITAQRALHANLRSNDGTELGTSGNPVRTDPTGTTPQPVSGTVTANLAAGTNNIGDVDILSIAAGDNNIGNVDVVTMPNVNLAAGTNTNEVVGDVAHDAAAAGNPLMVAGVSQDVDDTAPPNQVSAEGDATRLATSRDGAIFALPHGPRIWHASSEYTTQQTDATVKAAPGASLSLYITDIYLACNAAVTVTLEEGTTTLKWRYYASGQGDGVALSLRTPIKLTANTALTVTTSAAVTVTLVVTGYTAP